MLKALGFLALLAGSVWTGGLVAIAVAATAARRELTSAQQVRFFRTLGRAYLRVGGSALTIALGCGGALLAHGQWTREKIAATAVAGVLVLVTALAVAQARDLTKLKASLRPEGRRSDGGLVVRKTQRASLLRGLIVILTIAELVLAATMLA